MDTIWTIVNNQDKKVSNYFEKLYLTCIVRGVNFQKSQEFLLWSDLSFMDYFLECKSTLKGFIPKSSILNGNSELNEFIQKKTLDNEEVEYIRAHYLNNYSHLSKAISIFDSYNKRLEKEKRKNKLDNIFKIIIPLITAISTLIAVWLGYSLNRDKKNKKTLFKHCIPINKKQIEVPTKLYDKTVKVKKTDL